MMSRLHDCLYCNGTSIKPKIPRKDNFLFYITKRKQSEVLLLRKIKTLNQKIKTIQSHLKIIQSDDLKISYKISKSLKKISSDLDKTLSNILLYKTLIK